jgi:hypothetical protein
MTRIRFEGLRLPALSALRALPCRASDGTSGERRPHLSRHPVDAQCMLGRVLRLLREPALTRLLAAAIVVGLVVLSAPVLLPLVRWVFGLL